MATPPTGATGQEPQALALGSRGQVFDIVVEPDGRRGHWIRFDTALERAGVGPGDSIAVTLDAAPQWPEPDVPDDFAAALGQAPTRIRELWEDITPMARWDGSAGRGDPQPPHTTTTRRDGHVETRRR